MKYESLFRYQKNLINKVFYQLHYSIPAEEIQEKLYSLKAFQQGHYPFFDEIKDSLPSFNDQAIHAKHFIFKVFEALLYERLMDVAIYCDHQFEVNFFITNIEVIHAILKEFNDLFKKEHHTSVHFHLIENHFFPKLLQNRISDSEKFYVTKNKEEIEQIYHQLSDNISKISFQYFLRQRIDGHIRFGRTEMYPIAPPKITERWRNDRQNDPTIRLPKLIGAQPYLIDFFYKDTFILEQYAIENIVEAKNGDIVIDGGTFIGDTAIYFAEKVGKDGKVYAFEPIPDNVEKAKENLKLNNITNVELIPLALSDKEKQLYFQTAAIASTSYATNKETGLSVKAICLDDFVKERGLEKVDFIKCDLEGSDMAMLKGAKKTIQKYGPKLGLALYHHQEDFITITNFITSIRPEYKLYFRCETEPCLLAFIP